MKNICSLTICLAIALTNSAFAQWSTSGSNIYNTNAGYVGIGTPGPGKLLTLSTAAQGTSTLRFQNASNGFDLEYVNNGLGVDRLDFNPGGGGAKVSVLNNGNVGIGTSTPGSKLHVSGDIKAEGKIYSGGAYNFHTDAGGGFWASGDGSFAIGCYSNSNTFRIRTNTADRLTVDNNGNIGIGTASPGKLLTLSTAAQGTSTLRFQNASNGFDLEYVNNGLGVDRLDFNPGGGGAKVSVLNNGNVGIGTTSPLEKLHVNGKVIIGSKRITAGPHVDYGLAVDGKIVAKEMFVTVDNWSDFVFDENYKLMPLTEVEHFIAGKKHLPDVPTEKEIKENGNNLGQMDATLLRKLEELTLYVIQQQKEIEELKKQMQK